MKYCDEFEIRDNTLSLLLTHKRPQLAASKISMQKASVNDVPSA
jgi:hypothetical protein